MPQKRNCRAKPDLPPVHPGEILADFLNEMNISQYRLAQAIGVHPRRINLILHGQRAITADTALRLARAFGNSAEFWMNLQSHYDLEMAKDALDERLDDVRPLVA